MTEVDRILLEAERVATEAKLAHLRQALSDRAPATPLPRRAFKAPRLAPPSNPPTELAAARARQALRAAGYQVKR